MIKVQWFYRPEEAVNKEGEKWLSNDARELFYSFHSEDVKAESVMHRCIVHFIPSNLALPCRNKQPGFVVQKIYDAEEMRLCDLCDKSFAEREQHEIDLLIQETMSYLGELPNSQSQEPTYELDSQVNSKRFPRTDQHLKETRRCNPENQTQSKRRPRADHYSPISSTSKDASNYHAILDKFGALSGHTSRDTWLEKLLQAVQHACLPAHEQVPIVMWQVLYSLRINLSWILNTVNLLTSSGLQDGHCLMWPDSAVRAVYELERVAHKSLSSDNQKYNQKMRSMVFNLQVGCFCLQNFGNLCSHTTANKSWYI